MKEIPPYLAVEFALPLREYFDKNDNARICLLLIENSADSLRTSLDQYELNLPYNSNLKHTIFLLDHSVETLFKARLARDDKYAILRSQKDLSLEKTLGIRDCLKRLGKLGITLDRNLESAILDLHEARNSIWHFGFLGREKPLRSLISYCYCVYWIFLMKYFSDRGIRPMLRQKQFDTLMSFEDDLHLVMGYAAELMYEWSMQLDIEQDRYLQRHCKDCINFSVILDLYEKTAKCRCCGQVYKMSDFDNI
jgi:hypothetical protein